MSDKTYLIVNEDTMTIEAVVYSEAYAKLELAELRLDYPEVTYDVYTQE